MIPKKNWKKFNFLLLRMRIIRLKLVFQMLT